MAWVCCALLILICGPLFVCLPLTPDVVLYDMQALNLLNGGVQYRDIFETNLPGIVWIHVAIRGLIGHSSEAMRVFDLGVFAAIVGLLLQYVRRSGASHTTIWFTAGLLLLFYFSTSEWCHCQRDTWMLLPCLVALGLRTRKVIGNCVDTSREIGSRITWRWLGMSVVEGAVWAAAFWIKPHIVFPAAACWIVGVVCWRKERAGSDPATVIDPVWKVAAVDLVGVLIGAGLMGLAGIVWMVQSGAWPWFLDTFTRWNPEYLAAGRDRWTLGRLQAMSVRMHPWLWIHVPAVVVAVRLVIGRTATGTFAQDSRPHQVERRMFAAFYLGWLSQSLLLQHLMDYIHVPAVLLGVTLLAGSRWPVVAPVRRLTVGAFVAIALLACPLLWASRVALWPECITRGSTTDVRTALSDSNFPDWSQLPHVVEFLRDQQVGDGEVTCFNVHAIHIYEQLGVRPSTRFIGLSSLIQLFPGKTDEIRSALAGSRQRFIVTELIESGMKPKDARTSSADDLLSLPPGYPATGELLFPWSHPVVFRAGPYLVHAVASDLGRLTGRLPASDASRTNHRRD